MPLAPLSEHTLLVFWTQLLVLLVAARALGAAMRAIRQPTVIGELAAGVLLGPSVFGELAPDQWGWLFPGDAVQDGVLLAVGWIGVFLLLIVTGFETDLSLIRSLGRAAASTTVGSLVVPLAAGAALGVVLPSVMLGPEADRFVFALFVAASVSISALAVMAKVLSDLNLSRRNVGQLMLATGMANDAIGWILLGAIAGVATTGGFSLSHVLLPLAGLTVILGVAFTVGQRAVDFCLRSLRRFDAGLSGSLTVTVSVALAAGVATQALGLEAVLGGFIAGVLLGRSKFQRPETEQFLDGMTAGIFAPIFFASAGLRVDLRLLTENGIWAWTVIVTVVAFAAKLLGAYAGARRAALPGREAVALGLGLNCRGTLEIVIATVGLSLGVLNETSYAVLLTMVLATSTLAPPLLRMAVHNWPGTEEEQRRLEREESLRRNVLVRGDRVLLPSRGGRNSRAAAHLVHLVWPGDVEATVLSVSRNGSRPDVDGVVASLAGRPVERKHVSSDDPVDAVLKYAGLGYGVIAMGAIDRSEDGLISPLVDDLMARSPLPMVVVRRGRDEGRELRVRRVIVPAAGTVAGRAAQEVAFGLAARQRAEAVLVHVTKDGGSAEVAAAIRAAATGDDAQAGSRHRFRRLLHLPRGAQDGDGDVHPDAPAGARILGKAVAQAEQLGVDVRSVVREGSSVADEIATATRELRGDVVVLGATMREVDGRPFMGHAIEHLLESVDATVVLVTAPRATSD